LTAAFAALLWQISYPSRAEVAGPLDRVLPQC